LPCVTNWFSMVFFLPKEGARLFDIEISLNPSTLEQWRRNCTSEEVAVALPRFRLVSEVDLNAPLDSMGIKLAFTPAADFNGITTRKPFFIRTALQEACIEVEEEGVRASASTEMVLGVGIPKRFVADRPFLFLLRDNRTGMILFVGRVVDPSREQR